MVKDQVIRHTQIPYKVVTQVVYEAGELGKLVNRMSIAEVLNENLEKQDAEKTQDAFTHT